MEHLSPPQRISWEEYAMVQAMTGVMRCEDPYQKVGACGLNKDRRIIGVAYNGLASGKDVDPSFWADRDKRRPFMIHAEANLLSLCKRGECEILACTLLPCTACATNIATHGVKRVVYGQTYHLDKNAVEIFNFYGVELIQLDLKVLFHKVVNSLPEYLGIP